MDRKSEHARHYRSQRERTQSGFITEDSARALIAEKEGALKNLQENRTARRAELRELEGEIADFRTGLPPSQDVVGVIASKLTGILNKEVRERWTKFAAKENSLATVRKALSELDTRYRNVMGEIDDVVLAVLKTEAGWRKASTVERSIVVLKVAGRAYKAAVEEVRHRANGILHEKSDTQLAETESADETTQGAYGEFVRKELEILLQKAYEAGDAFQKAFDDYVSAMDKPPPWDVEVPIGKNVTVTLDLVKNRELLNIYTPETIGALEQRLEYLSGRLAVARTEITKRLQEIRAMKSAAFTTKKKSCRNGWDEHLFILGFFAILSVWTLFIFLILGGSTAI